MRHWRVEFDHEGEIRSIKACREADADTALVIYVKARDEAGAREAAYRTRQRVAQRIRRAKYRREGRCKCGRPMDDPKRSVRCELCRERSRRDARNTRARRRGEEPPEPTAGKSAPFQSNRANMKDADRASVLLEVARKWERCKTAGEFTEWLAEELRAVGIHSTKKSA